MSRRSAAALARKLRGLEDEYAGRVRRRVTAMWVDLEETARSSPVGRVPSLLVAGLDEAILYAFGEGVLLLRAFTTETGVSAVRDIRAVASNTGQDVSLAVEAFEPFGWEAGAIEMWEEWMEGVEILTATELRRQLSFATLYDDPPEDGFYDRLFSPVPLRVQGRSGIGVFPAVTSTMVGGITNPAYQMVNKQKLALYEPLLETVNG